MTKIEELQHQLENISDCYLVDYLVNYMNEFSWFYECSNRSDFEESLTNSFKNVLMEFLNAYDFDHLPSTSEGRPTLPPSGLQA